jgi:hypothetical protein
MINLSGILKTAGAGFAAYGQEKDDAIKKALADAAAKRQAQNDAISNQIKLAGIDPAIQGKIAGAKADAGVNATVTTARQLSPIKVDEAVSTAKAVQPIAVGTHATERDYDNDHPAPVAPSFSFPTATTVDGKQEIFKGNNKTGELAPTGVAAKAGTGSSVPASIRNKVAENESTLATITDALSSLDAHPDAVGLDKGLPGIGTMLDQRRDPEGVATRALIANIGSLQIHTRTGANMNVREEPRLAPFVPGVNDTPEALRTKLSQLQKFLKIENDALVGAAPAAHAPPNPSTPAPSHQATAPTQTITPAEYEHLKALGYSDAQLRAKYTVKP